jgi:xanthine dehydrogenase accessory factor
MIGSRRKARLIFSQFLEDELASEEQLAKVACPVGLDIQAVSVQEIALSVMAQFVQKRAETVHRPVGDGKPKHAQGSQAATRQVD